MRKPSYAERLEIVSNAFYCLSKNYEPIYRALKTPKLPSQIGKELGIPQLVSIELARLFDRGFVDYVTSPRYGRLRMYYDIVGLSETGKAEIKRIAAAMLEQNIDGRPKRAERHEERILEMIRDNGGEPLPLTAIRRALLLRPDYVSQITRGMAQRGLITTQKIGRQNFISAGPMAPDGGAAD